MIHNVSGIRKGTLAVAMTIAEKILAKHSGRESVRPGEYVTAGIDLVGLKYSVLDIQKGMEKSGIRDGLSKVWDKDKVVIVNDYDGPAPDKNVRTAQRQKEVRDFIAKMQFPHFYDVSAGICHQVIMDHGFVLPGNLAVATDSHAPIYGALNCAATGIGEAEMAWVLTYGELWFRVPDTIKIVVNGTLPDHVMAKDLYLYISGQYGTDFAQYKSLEWYGSVIQDMSLDGRMCLGNQAEELGAKFCLFEADEKVHDFLAARTRQPYKAIDADLGAHYMRVITIKADNLVPMVALPHDMSVVRPAEQLSNIQVHQATIGGCASGRLEDIAAAALILKGRRVKKGVRCIVGAADEEVFRAAIHAGYIETLVEAGVTVCHPHCGPCTGGIGALADGEICITSTTRNFKGRMGSYHAEIYMGSPATVAASALTGCITDPREVI